MTRMHVIHVFLEMNDEKWMSKKRFADSIKWIYCNCLDITVISASTTWINKSKRIHKCKNTQNIYVYVHASKYTYVQYIEICFFICFV